MRRLIALIAILFVLKLSFAQEPVKSFYDYQKSYNAMIYMNEALEILRENSIYKYSINWDKLKKDVFEIGKNAQTPEETYPAIRHAIKQLGDNHSRFMTYNEFESINRHDLPIPTIITELIDNNIAYIKISGFRGVGDEPAKRFAQKIQDIIKELDNHNINYWIVDLEDNNGGNVWPMLLGLSPLLGVGVKGYLVDADNNYFNWGISMGGVFYNNKELMRLPNPYYLKNGISKLAIIVGKRTASAGEAVAISFMGNNNTKFFGSHTSGKTMGNTGYVLSDGARVYVTRTKFADRNKSVFGFPIEPDIETSNGCAKEAAIKWIYE